MHELSLCESILKIIERQAQKERFDRVVKVRVALGEQSCASEESLAFCFPHVVKDTIANGAILEFIRTQGDEMRVVDMVVG
jgi:hydrogenase nickel incorporation protein HypA/HybF